MIPGFARSSPDRPVALLYPDNVGRINGVDLELGTTSGLGDGKPRDAVYECRVAGATAEYKRLDQVAWTSIITVATMSPTVSFTFDQLMRPMVVYQLGAGLNRVPRTAFLYWFDTALLSYQTVTVANVSSPVLTFDYPLDSSTSFAEVSLWYIRDGNLCYRRQNDRFTVEYIFAVISANFRVIAAIGLGRNFRLHITLER